MADLEKSEGNKVPPPSECHLHKNEPFKEPTAHEKNSLLTSLRNKLDKIDKIIKKAKQNTLTEESNQKILNQDASNVPKQILAERSKEEAVHTEVNKNVPNNPIPDEICNFQPSHQKLLALKPKDKAKQTELPESTTSNAIPQIQAQKNQNDIVEQIVTTQFESKPSQTPQDAPPPIPPAVRKDYSNITTFGEADEAIKAEPENYKHYVTRAELYIKKQDYKNSEADYKKAQELTQSKDVAVLTGLAKVYDLSGQPAVALTIYSQALELNLSSTEILNDRAHCYETLGQEENFFKDIEKAIEIDPNNAKNYISRAEHYMVKNDFQKSLKDVNKIVDLKPDNASARYFRGVLNYNLKNYQDCFSDMQKALELKTNENEVYRYLGICSYKSNDLSTAMNFLKKSIEFGFDDGDIYYYKSYTEFKLGLFDIALEDADKSIVKDSQKYEYYLLRAKIYNEKNIIDKAEKDYDKALKLNASFDTFVERGEFFAKHKKYKDSIKDYTAGITLNSQNAEVYKQRGYVYQKLNKNEEAEADFEQALKLNPSADVPIEAENKNIPQEEAHQQEKQVSSQQEVSQVKQETPHTPSKPIVQTNVEPIKSKLQETIVASKNATSNQPSSKQQDMQQHEEQKVETPIDQTPSPGQVSLAPQEAKAQVKTGSEKVITSQENNEEKTKKEGLFTKLFKKSDKEIQKNESESDTPIPSVHPNDIETAYNRANINYKNKKYEAALEDLSKIFSKESAYAKGYLLRASIYAESGDTAKALEDLNKVIELLPQTFLAYFKRAEIYSLQNNDDAAFADFGKTIELNQKFGA
ncbi:MAG: tetratricopeptide repeat protein, partial [Endomicrobium sp.]|nr:tetratricopeptide repeat protein [Endomicrobium sp.]